MVKGVELDEFLKAGGKVKGVKVAPEIIDALALKLLGVLADAPSNEVRRRALDKARRMLSKR